MPLLTSSATAAATGLLSGRVKPLTQVHVIRSRLSRALAGRARLAHLAEGDVLVRAEGAGLAPSAVPVRLLPRAAHDCYTTESETW